jgi:hypothetical protein
VVALQAPVELSGWLVSTPSLKEPPTRLVMATLGALYLGGREGVELVLGIPHDLDWRSSRKFLLRSLGHSPSGLVAVAAIVADVGYTDFTRTLNLLQLESRSALGAELQPDPPPSSFSTLW